MPGIPGIQSQAHAYPVPRKEAVLARLLFAKSKSFDLETCPVMPVWLKSAANSALWGCFDTFFLFSPTAC